jgi:hypothetical protein
MILQKCKCGGELALVEDFFEAGGIKGYKQTQIEFEERFEKKMRKLEDFYCKKCGAIHSKNFVAKGYTLDTLLKIIKKKMKEGIKR